MYLWAAVDLSVNYIFYPLCNLVICWANHTESDIGCSKSVIGEGQHRSRGNPLHLVIGLLPKSCHHHSWFTQQFRLHLFFLYNTTIIKLNLFLVLQTCFTVPIAFIFLYNTTIVKLYLLPVLYRLSGILAANSYTITIASTHNNTGITRQQRSYLITDIVLVCCLPEKKSLDIQEAFLPCKCRSSRVTLG